MPTLLILYPGATELRAAHLRRYRRVIRALGFKTVLADRALKPEDRKVFDHVVELPETEQVGEAVEALHKLFEARQLDGVLAQWESSLPAGALLAERLGLPGPGVEPAYLTINKYLSRACLAAAGVPVPAFGLAETADEVKRFAREHGYPVVLKGVSSSLCRLVTFVGQEEGVDAAVAEVRAGLRTSLDIARLRSFAQAAGLDLGCDPERQFLVEAYCGGEPVETDGLVVAGEPWSFGVTEQVLTAPPLFRIEGYLCPADRPREELARIEEVSTAALKAVGLLNSGFSIEMKSSAGDLRVIEVNGRLGWDEGFGELFEAVVGTQPALLAAQLALGYTPRIDRQPGRFAALAYASCYDNARVARVPPAAAVQKAEKAHGVKIGIEAAVGSRYFRGHHPEAAPHLAWALATSRGGSREAYRAARAAMDSLTFELEPVEAR